MLVPYTKICKLKNPFIVQAIKPNDSRIPNIDYLRKKAIALVISRKIYSSEWQQLYLQFYNQPYKSWSKILGDKDDICDGIVNCFEKAVSTYLSENDKLTFTYDEVDPIFEKCISTLSKSDGDIYMQILDTIREWIKTHHLYINEKEFILDDISTMVGSAKASISIKNDVTNIKELAEKGDVEAQCKLAFRYACGRGVEHSFDKEVFWLKKAIDQGNTDAMYSLALRYALGGGTNIPKDMTEAYKWAKKAAELGNQKAIDLLRSPEFIEVEKRTVQIQKGQGGLMDKNFIFGDYSLDGLMKYVEKSIGVADPFFKEGLIRVLEIEKINFQQLIENVKTISKEYYMGGSKLAISKKYRLHLFFDFFKGYIDDVRLARISIGRFSAFLAQEALDSKVYISNQPANGEDPISAALNGKTPSIVKITPDLVAKFVDRLASILEKDKKTVYWLSQNIASYEPSEWYDKYDDYKNPSLSEILEWFMQYCKYEKSKV